MCGRNEASRPSWKRAVGTEEHLGLGLLTGKLAGSGATPPKCVDVYSPLVESCQAALGNRTGLARSSRILAAMFWWEFDDAADVL